MRCPLAALSQPGSKRTPVVGHSPCRHLLLSSLVSKQKTHTSEPPTGRGETTTASTIWYLSLGLFSIAVELHPCLCYVFLKGERQVAQTDPTLKAFQVLRSSRASSDGYGDQQVVGLLSKCPLLAYGHPRSNIHGFTPLAFVEQLMNRAARVIRYVLLL